MINDYMKINPNRVFLVTLILILSFSTSVAQKNSLNVLTYNIRLANADESPNTWTERKENVFSVIKSAHPDVFGLQEVLFEQVTDLQNVFPDFVRVGVGRDDGEQAGEYSPVFYNFKKYLLLSSGTFWLSQTPLVAGSRGWDAACNRVVSWTKLLNIASGETVFVFNTHFDHMGEIARRNSAKLLLHSVDSLAGKSPVVILGDFNSTPDSEPYLLLTDHTNVNSFIDARFISSKTEGPEYTFTGFKVNDQPGKRIDYIFLKNVNKANSYFVNSFNTGKFYPSDHLPVSAVIRFN